MYFRIGRVGEGALIVQSTENNFKIIRCLHFVMEVVS